MSEALMIGTRGWSGEAGGDFYPADLPEDWRFCYYSNNLRSVLVPYEDIARAGKQDVAQWLEDSDPAFRFVLELPKSLAQEPSTLAEHLERLEPVAVRTAGLLLRVPEQDHAIDRFEALLQRLADIAPLCVDLPEGAWRDPARLEELDRQGAGLAWHCEREPQPRAGGQFTVALAPPANGRVLRQWVERLAQWQRPETRAGLFFEGPAIKVAQEARLIAELMGV